MQREKEFRLTLPDELSIFFESKYIYGNTEHEVEKKGRDMLTSFFESKRSPVEKVISYDFGANLHIKNPANDYPITTVGVGHSGPSPSVSFQYSVGYRQSIPDPRDLSKTTLIYFTYNKDHNDRREHWSPKETTIPWSQSVEDFFEAFTKYLENAILNMFMFLDQPFNKLKGSIDTLGSTKALPLLTEKRDLIFYPSHMHGYCPVCNKERISYTNANGDTEIRCRVCGTSEKGKKDEYVMQRLQGSDFLAKRIQEQ
jgi:hypothetical protein